MKQGIS